MGVVWKAEDLSLRRTVAIKFLTGESLSREARRSRFLREARLAASLNHPSICTIHEVGEVEAGREPDLPSGEVPAAGTPFIAMELVEGESLAERMRREGAIPPEKALGLARQMAEGLAVAHAAGIVHRDLKPGNVVLTPDGRAKILDFGLARTVAGPAEVQGGDPAPSALKTLSGDLTREGTIVGTTAYMSPEQAQGLAVDTRSDIFSFGIVLYEMVTGSPPFRGATATSTRAKIIEAEPPSLQGLEESLRPGLERLLGRCLARKPGDRLRNGRELAKALEEACREAELTGAGGGAPGRRHPGRRILAWLAAAAAVVLLLAYLQIRTGREAGAGGSEGAEGGGAAPVRRTMLVVLPFENLGPQDRRYFAAGMTEEIASRLAAVRRIGVISRTSANQYDRTGKTIPQIGQELSVDYVLDGTVRWAPGGEGEGKVRVTPQLVRVSDDSRIWSETYDRQIADVFDVQTDIANRVIEELDITLEAAERILVEDAPTRSLEAYESYARARDLDPADLGSFPEYDARFAELMERATALDPAFIDAWAGQALYHSFIYSLLDRSEGRRGRARRAMESAEGIDPGHYQSRLARGAFHYFVLGDNGRALEEFQAAREIFPNDALSQKLIGVILREQGRWDESVESLESAFRLNPRDGDVARNLAATHKAMRRFREAIRYAERAVMLEPEVFATVWHKADTLIRWKGDLAAARELLARQPEESGLENLFWYRIGWIFVNFYSRDYAGAIEEARRMQPPSPALGVLRLHLIAAMEALENGEDAARPSLEQARGALEALLAADPGNAQARRWLARNLLRLGRVGEALEAARQAVEQSAGDRFTGPKAREDLAFVYGATGRRDEAVNLLKELLATRYEDPLTPRILALDPTWDSLRDHPGFQALLEE